MPAVRTPPAPLSLHRALRAKPSRLPTFREAAYHALFPVMVDTWLRDQRIFFCRLAILMRAGLPVYQALNSILDTTRNPRMKLPIYDACRTIAEGGMLSDSFARFPETFSELQIALLRAGEIHGRMEIMLDQITAHIEREIELRRALSRQTLYAKIVLVFGLFGIPLVFGLVFGGSIILIARDALLTAVQLALCCVIVFCVGRTWLARSPQARETYELAKWRLPGIGAISRTYALARFGHGLSSLYSAGVNMSTSLRLAADASASYRVALMAEGAAQAAERGESIVPYMRAAGFVPENMVNLLDTGFSTGEMDKMMSRAAEYLEGEAETKAHKLAYLFSQALFILVAVILVNAYLGPLFQILPSMLGM